MAPPNILRAQAVAVRQPEPPEGRKSFQFPPLVFNTNADQFQFNAQSLGNIPCSGMQSAWIDAQNLPTTNFLFIDVNNGQQIFKVQGGTQGYLVIVGQWPLNILFSIDGGSPVTITAILYNYNALFTGGTTQTAPVASGSGGGSGGTGAASSGGGNSGGARTGPGNRPTL
jgi:hypothetical protein